MELTKLKRFFSVLKRVTPKRIEDVRVPFLAIVCPPTRHFRYLYCRSASLFAGCPVFTVGASCQCCDRFVVYFHGGGFISGDLSGYSAMCENLISKLGTTTCLVFAQYPLAPEANFDTIFRTGFKVLEWVTFFSKKYCVVGDSAGGGLALSAVQSVCGSTLQPPECLVLYSPLCNIERDTVDVASDAVLSSYVVQWSTQFGLCGCEDARQINPAKSSMKNLCKTMIFCSKDEVLHVDCVELFTSCKQSDVQVWMIEHDCSLHACVLFSRFCPEGLKELEISTHFINESLK